MNDVPDITIHDLLRRQREKLAGIAAITGGNIPDLHEPEEGEAMPRVRCIDTGEEFDTVSDAERAKGIGKNTLGAAIRRSGTCKGLQWEFLDAPKPADGNGDAEAKAPAVPEKVRKLAKVGRIAFRRKPPEVVKAGCDNPPAEIQPVVPAAPAAIDPAATVNSPGKLRVVLVEYEGGGLTQIVEQLAQFMKGKA